MNIKELLPIGSVVRLMDGEKKLMIIGVKQTDSEGDGKEYDYLGVLYPEGYIGEEYQYLFDHDVIEEVYFKGYDEAERQDFIERLAALYQNR